MYFALSAAGSLSEIATGSGTPSPDRSEFYKLIAEVLPVLLVALVAFDIGVDDRLRREAAANRRGAYWSMWVWFLYVVFGVAGEAAAVSLVYQPFGWFPEARRLAAVSAPIVVGVALLLLTGGRWYAAIFGAPADGDRNGEGRHRQNERSSEELEGEKSVPGKRLEIHAWRLSVTWEKPHGG